MIHKNSRAQALNMICGSVKTEMNLPNKNCGECWITNLFMKIIFILDSFCNILFWCTRLGAVGRISCITRITRSWCRSSRNCSLILIWISILGIRVGLRCAYSSLKSTHYIKSRNCKYRLYINSFYTEENFVATLPFAWFALQWLRLPYAFRPTCNIQPIGQNNQLLHQLHLELQRHWQAQLELEQLLQVELELRDSEARTKREYSQSKFQSLNSIYSYIDNKKELRLTLISIASASLIIPMLR